MVQSLVDDTTPWDRGVRDAHGLSSAPGRRIHDCLDAARTRRQEFLTRVVFGRKRYLDGLIWGLEQELRRRERAE